MGAMWFARLLAAASLVSVLLLARRSLDIEGFAEFAFLVGLTAWLPMLDFGFGSVLQNDRFAARTQAGDSKRVLWCSALGAGLALAGTSLVALVGYLLFRQSSSFGITLLREPANLVVALCLALGGWASLYARQLAAEDRLTLAAAVSAAQSAAAIASVATCVALGVRVTWVFSLAFFVPFTAPPLLAMVYTLTQNRPAAFPSRSELRGAARRAMTFWGVTVLSLIVVQIDQILAFRLLSAHDFAAYVIASKIVAFAYFPVSALLAANWTRIAKLHHERNAAGIHAFVYATTAWGVAWLAVATIACALLAPTLGTFFKVDAGTSLATLLLGLGALAGSKVWTEVNALVLQSRGQVESILRYLPFQAASSAGAQWLLVGPWGAFGLMAGCALSYAVTSHWLLPLAVRRMLSDYLPERPSR